MTDRTTHTDCPSDDEVRGYLSRALEPDAARVVEAHLAGCSDCRRSLAVAARLASEPLAGEDHEQAVAALAAATRNGALDAPRSGSRRRSWVWPLAVAAGLVVIGGLGYWAWTHARSGTLDRGERELASVLQVQRPSQMRLAKAPYAAFRGTRGAPDRRAETARALLEAAATEETSVRALRALARARLATGDARGAVAAMDQAVALAPGDADLLVDRAVMAAEAGAAKAARADLDAVLAKDPRRPDAVFDRALLDEREGRTSDAVDGWNRYLELDGTSPWSDEARRALERGVPSEARP